MQLNEYENVANAIEKLIPRSSFEIPKKMLQYLRWKPNVENVMQMISPELPKLSPTQQATLKFIVERGGTGLITHCNAVRRPCILAANILNRPSLLIVVSDESREKRWKEECKKSLRGPEATVMKLEDWYRNLEVYDMIIFDDSTSSKLLRKAAASVKRGIDKIESDRLLEKSFAASYRAKSVIIISPEIVGSHHFIEVIPLLMILEPRMDRFELTSRYCSGGFKDNKWQTGEDSRKKERDYLIQKKFVLTVSDDSGTQDSQMTEPDESGIADISKPAAQPELDLFDFNYSQELF